MLCLALRWIQVKQKKRAPAQFTVVKPLRWNSSQTVSGMESFSALSCFREIQESPFAEQLSEVFTMSWWCWIRMFSYLHPCSSLCEPTVPAQLVQICVNQQLVCTRLAKQLYASCLHKVGKQMAKLWAVVLSEALLCCWGTGISY